MRTVRTIAAVREHVGAARAGGRTIALVPTMGAFHAGHEALIAAARTAAGDDGLVVVSLFVNPTQFNQAADLAAYPRSEADDAARAAELGVDLLFAPAVEEMYPDGFATTVTVAGLSDVLEGAQRPGHFAGVTTVVTKLLNIVAPDVVLFGQKDAQQVVVVRRLVRDLDLPVRLEVIPTVREPDGLALSSRNRLLDPADRAGALSLSRGLRAAREALEAGERDAARLGDAVRAAMDGVEPEYVAVVDPDTLAPLDAATDRMLVAVAARVGPVRLIDNLLIDPRQTQVATPSGAPTTAKE
jgi:pantoate--beta-alanine ligase